MSQTESETRKSLIDKRLADAGWNVSDPSQVITELAVLRTGVSGVNERIESYDARGYSDYALIGDEERLNLFKRLEIVSYFLIYKSNHSIIPLLIPTHQSFDSDVFSPAELENNFFKSGLVFICLIIVAFCQKNYTEVYFSDTLRLVDITIKLHFIIRKVEHLQH